MFPVAAVQALARMFGATSQVRSGFSLTAVGAGSLGITVASGTAWVNGVYLNYAGAGSPVTPGAASATQGRYDLIVVASGAVVPSIVAGTAGEAPVPPALAAGALLLGYAFIGPTATDYTDATKAFIADYSMPIVNFAGTAAAPAMPFTGDLDTGWISPGGDRIQTVTGGVARSETTSAGHFVPVSTSITDLGTSALRWRDGYVVSLHADAASVTDLAVANWGRCRVFNSTNLTVASNVSTSITFDSERYDPLGMHSSLVNTGRVVFTTSGTFLIGGGAFITGTTSIATVDVQLRINETTAIATQSIRQLGGNMTLNLAGQWYAATSGDYVELFIINRTSTVVSVNFDPQNGPELWAVRVA